MELRWIRIRRRLWSDDNSKLYRSKDYNAIIYEPYGHPGPVRLDFLPELPNILGVWLPSDGQVDDDSAVFSLPDVRKLMLESDSARNPIALDAVKGSLTSLTTLWRNGILSISEAVHLEEVTIDKYGGTDLHPLGTLVNLRFLRLDMRRSHKISVEGLEGCRRLERFWMEGGTLTAAPQIPESVTRAEFIGSRAVELSFVRDLPNLRVLSFRNCGSVPSIKPLAGHPTLEGLDLSGTTVEDRDFSPLSSVPHLNDVARNQGYAK